MKNEDLERKFAAQKQYNDPMPKGTINGCNDRAGAAMGTAKGHPDMSPFTAKSNKAGCDVHPVLAKLRALPEHTVLELSPEEMKLVIINDWMDEIGANFRPKVPTPVTQENIRVGDLITVKKWLSHKDGYWVGDLIEVKALALPFVFAEIKDQYGSKRHKFNMNNVEFERVSQEFLDGMAWLREKDAA